jgi:hypothetical protein
LISQLLILGHIRGKERHLKTNTMPIDNEVKKKNEVDFCENLSSILTNLILN